MYKNNIRYLWTHYNILQNINIFAHIFFKFLLKIALHFLVFFLNHGFILLWHMHNL